jgi:hypothetical protein
MTKLSNWETAKENSIYHFDVNRRDPRWDTIIGLGQFAGDWSQELANVIESAKPANWASILKDRKRYMGGLNDDAEIPELGDGLVHPAQQDLVDAGGDPEMTLLRFEYNLAPIFQKMTDLFALKDPYARVHVQYPGEVFDLHLDRLHRWNPDDHTRTVKFIVHLNDWEPGHFYQYGNYSHTNWRAGEVHTFDWQNVPHATANASRTPRVLLHIQGTKTEQTELFLKQLKAVSEYKL